MSALEPSVVVVGISQDLTCGVRDHARRLSAALEQTGVRITTVWHTVPAGDSPRLTQLANEVLQRWREERADAILLHYSVFSFSWHGVPIGMPGFAARLRLLGAPIVLFAHELAYPWRQRGWRGAVHAVTQRIALVPLLAASTSVVLTTPDRVHWLRTRRWLPNRLLSFAPVFSTIDPYELGPDVEQEPCRVGLFSFSADAPTAHLVTAAVADVAELVPEVHLVLIGAPGPASLAGQQWQGAAAVTRCRLSFTGIGDETEVSRQIAACALIAFPDPSGPTTRRTSLAAALAHGKPVIALRGSQVWEEFVDSEVLAIVAPNRGALAAEVRRLLGDRVARVELGLRAREFYENRLSVQSTATTVMRTIQEAISARQKEGSPPFN